MALFKVPGWSIPTAPVQEDSHRTSKKRKLSNTEGGDLDRQLKKLLHDRPTMSKGSPKSHVHGKNVKAESSDQKPKDIPGPSSVAGVTRRNKKKAGNHPPPLPNQATAPDDSVIPLTDLQRKMKETLDGARFRYVV